MNPSKVKIEKEKVSGGGQTLFRITVAGETWAIAFESWTAEEIAKTFKKAGF